MTVVDFEGTVLGGGVTNAEESEEAHANDRWPRGAREIQRVHRAYYGFGRSDTALARERFVSDLLTRGEAATRDKSGKLPLGATHVIKKRKPGGSAEVERVRFKTF